MYVSYQQYKYGSGTTRREHDFLKLHACVGVRTNVVVAAVVTDSRAAEAPQFARLVQMTARRFPVDEVTADKAYLSTRNLEVVESVGAKPFIPFKLNSRPNGSELWDRAFHFFQFHRPEFLAHYHQRSNVETTFAMIKKKFMGLVRSKLPTTQINEVLLKVIAHNLVVLVAAMFELGLDPKFWAEPTQRSA